jgi:isopenicillin-N epimerase
MRSQGRWLLYVRCELQGDVHPPVISWGYEGDDPTFLSRHERQGTRDPSAYVTVPAAIEWQFEHD